jgi:hypothetical protein
MIGKDGFIFFGPRGPHPPHLNCKVPDRNIYEGYEGNGV